MKKRKSDEGNEDKNDTEEKPAEDESVEKDEGNKGQNDKEEKPAEDESEEKEE